MRTWLARLRCAVTGHAPDQLISVAEMTFTTIDEFGNLMPDYERTEVQRAYICPRCRSVARLVTSVVPVAVENGQ